MLDFIWLILIYILSLSSSLTNKMDTNLIKEANL